MGISYATSWYEQEREVHAFRGSCGSGLLNYQKRYNFNGMNTNIQKIQNEVGKELEKKEVMQALVATTFKGLSEQNIKQAIVEGIMRGFLFQDFLEKNIYALPYGEKYSLVTSIDYARKLGMRSGVVGVSEPKYEEKDGRIIACSVTVKRTVGKEIGEFSSKVYFQEYTTGANLWVKKPRTMIAKVAEMHALRKACPEQLSQMYTVDEMDDNGNSTKAETKATLIDISVHEKLLKVCKNTEELKKVWSDMPMEAKTKLQALKNQIKSSLK